MSMLDTHVLVCGGGMAGTLAAVAAARAGAPTMLVERYGFLGGSATAAAVGQFAGWRTRAGRKVIAGLADEVVSRLQDQGATSGHTRFTMSTGHVMDRVQYDPEILKVVLDAMVTEAGVRLIFHAVVAEVSATGRTVDALRLLARSGSMEIRPRLVVDASGDLDVMARAGARFLPLAAGERLQPATMMFRFGPIDFEAFDAVPPAALAALARQGAESGALARAALHASRIPGTRDAWFNISRLAVDATDPFALSAAETQGRRQALSAARYITHAVPGCAQGRLVAFAPQVGVRESRRIEGEYVLTAEDLRRPARFADTVAFGAYPIDIHPAQGTGLQFETMGEDHAYPIPYRCLVPSTLDNALVAGRGISATHEAHAATRVMPTVMAIGQAAGTAASMLAAAGAPARELDIAALQAALGRDGACLA